MLAAVHGAAVEEADLEALRGFAEHARAPRRGGGSDRAGASRLPSGHADELAAATAGRKPIGAGGAGRALRAGVQRQRGPGVQAVADGISDGRG